MIAYFGNRIAYTLPVLFIVSALVFIMFYVMPGDPALNMVGENATPEALEQTRAALGLSEPIHIRFGIWLAAIGSGDLGTSIFTGMPVSKLILQRIEPTLSLAICAIIITACLAIPIGIAAAWKSGSLFDRTVMVGAVMGFSIPAFFVGYLLVLVFSLTFNWLPVQGFVSVREGFGPFIRHMILPSLTVSLTLMALITRVTRATMLEVLAQDYIRTAHAKGLPTLTVLFVHALKNASIPVVTVLGFAIALLLGGVIVTETVFAIHGVGLLMIEAITRRDYPVIQGVVLMFALVYISINLLIDLSYPILDPRIRQ